MKSADFFDLVRIPNAPTAVADIWAAAIVAHALVGAEFSGWRIAAASVSSLGFYLAGMTLNDVADADLDARERPSRPIPSGRVSRSQAIAIAALLAFFGGVGGWLAGERAFAVSLVLFLAIVAYDTVLAGRPVVGPLGMAMCRGLNFCLGLAAVGALQGLPAVGAAVGFVYVFGLTHLSLGEVSGGARSAVVIAVLTTAVALLSAVLLARYVDASASVLRWLAPAVPVSLLLVRSGPRLFAAWRMPRASTIGPSVGTLVGGITLVNAALAAAALSWPALLPFLPLYAMQEILRRRFRVT